MARPSWRTPALLTSTSTGPKRSRTAANASCTAPASATSACTSPPVRASVATVKPSSRRRSAIAAPIPRVPPVTSAQPSPLRACLRPADMLALLPAHDPRAPHEARAEGGQRDRVTRVQPPVALGLAQRQRDRRRRRVGDAVDVQRDALAGEAELGRRRLDDARVGLVGDEQVDVVDADARPVERGPRRLHHPGDGVAVDLAALHAQGALVDLGVEQVGLGAVGVQLEAGAAAALVVAGGHDDGAGAVAEEHGGAAVAVVGQARQRLGAADQHDARAAALDQRGRLVQGVEEAGAGGVEVAGAPAPPAPIAQRHIGREARRDAVRRDRGDDDVVDLGRGRARRRPAPRRTPRPPAAASGSPAAQVAALADARAPHDPVVGRVEALLEVGVGDALLGQGGPDAEEAGRHPARRAAQARGGRAATATLTPSRGRQGALDQARQHRRRARARRSARRPRRAAPAASRASAPGAAGSRPARGARRRTARRCRWRRRGSRAACTGVRASAVARRAAAGSMSGEWNAPPTSRRRARAPVSSRATSLGLLDARRARRRGRAARGRCRWRRSAPRRAASARTAPASPPSIATIPPGTSSAGLAPSPRRARRRARRRPRRPAPRRRRARRTRRASGRRRRPAHPRPRRPPRATAPRRRPSTGTAPAAGSACPRPGARTGRSPSSSSPRAKQRVVAVGLVHALGMAALAREEERAGSHRLIPPHATTARFPFSTPVAGSVECARRNLTPGTPVVSGMTTALLAAAAVAAGAPAPDPPGIVLHRVAAPTHVAARGGVAVFGAFDPATRATTLMRRDRAGADRSRRRAADPAAGLRGRPSWRAGRAALLRGDPRDRPPRRPRRHLHPLPRTGARLLPLGLRRAGDRDRAPDPRHRAGPARRRLGLARGARAPRPGRDPASVRNHHRPVGRPASPAAPAGWIPPWATGRRSTAVRCRSRPSTCAATTWPTS